MEKISEPSENINFSNTVWAHIADEIEKNLPSKIQKIWQEHLYAPQLLLQQIVKAITYSIIDS